MYPACVRPALNINRINNAYAFITQTEEIFFFLVVFHTIFLVLL